jgi:hypothetical protein
MNQYHSRREFMRDTGLRAAALPFLLNLPSLGFANQVRPKQRLVVVFSPDGVIPETFWPQQTGTDFELPESLQPLAPFRNRLLTLYGVCDRIRGDGDNHMRGIGCLLTGIELFPGNIQGGSHTPAGWSSGISIDQEISNFLRGQESSRTRFGSLEFGVLVPSRSDTWTRMVYRGPNQPVAPVNDPYEMFQKLYGRIGEREALGSILDDVQEDLRTLKTQVSVEDRQLLERNTTFVRQLEQELRAQQQQQIVHQVPQLEPGVLEQNDSMPAISDMQIEMIVNSFLNDFTRVASLQYTNSVGQARFTWLDIPEGQHTLSHEPDQNEDAREKLTRINRWYGEQIARLARRLQETPEPGGSGTLLDSTTIVWTNELGKGNSHTLDNIPFVLVGGGLGFRTGRALDMGGQPHNRLLLSLAHGFGHLLENFGNPHLCQAGPFDLS